MVSHTCRYAVLITVSLFISLAVYSLWHSHQPSSESTLVKDDPTTRTLEPHSWRFDDTLHLLPWRSISEVYVTEEEKAFPLAYSILIYRDPEQVLLLLRAIYRAHNLYCIHIDSKVAPHVKRQMHALFHNNANLTNVFVSSQSVSVVHSSFTTLEADLICMRELLQRGKTWRYFINLTGQEYPRKTNLELVRILRDAMNGSNLVHKDVLLFNRVVKRLWNPPPYDLHLWKGWVHIVVKREFVEFVVNDKHAIALADYLRDTVVPDESFFSTLNHNHHLQVPGGFTGDDLTSDYYPYVNRLKVWQNEYSAIPCHGKFVRLICIFGDKNFEHLTNEADPSLFINKFILSINGALLQRIDKWFHERQKRIYSNPSNVNVSFYELMPQVQNHFV